MQERAAKNAARGPLALDRPGAAILVGKSVSERVLPFRPTDLVKDFNEGETGWMRSYGI